MRVFTLTSTNTSNPSDEEALLIIPESWNAPAILDALLSLDLRGEGRGFADYRASDHEPAQD